MVLPDLGGEAKGDERQQPVGDGGTQDEDFIGLPTGLDGEPNLKVRLYGTINALLRGTVSRTAVTPLTTDTAGE